MKKQFDFRKMSFYQIWIRSFCDGNGDGIGDLYGVYDKLEYIKSLGVDGIWFSPIFPSPNADYGYDITDYKNIHPDYGDLDQFRKVLDHAHALGLKVLLDLVINHTSDEHPWFIESCKGGEDNPYKDYYIWRDPLLPVKSAPGAPGAPGGQTPWCIMAESAPGGQTPRRSMAESVPGGQTPRRSMAKSVPGGQTPRRSMAESVPGGQTPRRSMAESVPGGQTPRRSMAESAPGSLSPRPPRSPRSSMAESVPGGLSPRSPRSPRASRQSSGREEKLLPPNNWFSQFEGIAWEYNAQRGQYYLHIFARKQPDLNMDNPRVREEVKEIMRFWLDLGVDGFREDVINFISKVKDLPNGLPFLPAINGLPYYKDGPNLHQYLAEFREVAKEYGAVQIGEAPFTGVKKARSYVTGRGRVLDMLIQFDTMMADCFFTEYVHHPFSLRKLKRAFDRWQYGLALGGWNALYLENHDHPRVIDRYGSLQYRRESGTMLAAVYLFQRGTPFLYQGQELGMTNIALDSIDKYLDLASINAYHTFHLREPVEKRLRRIHRSSRDSARTPVQWSSTPGAGFTAGTPWFYINPNYRQINAEAEEKDPSSILHFYRRCLALRKQNETLLKGTYRDLAPRSRRLYMYARSYRGETILVACSFSKKAFRYSLPRGLAGRERDLVLGNYTGEKDAVPACMGRKILLRPYEVQIWRFPRKEESRYKVLLLNNL